MRLDRLTAIAERDLRIELSGRSGLILPAVTLAILLPIATAPPLPEAPLESMEIPVAGDVPEEVLALPRVRLDPKRAFVWFEAPDDGGPLIVRGDFVPADVREVLDTRYPGVRTVVFERTAVNTPQRSLLLALIAASVLTGSLAQSLPGERSQGTLDTLMGAAVTRAEIVTGKWLAWTFYGSFGALSTAAVAIVLGRQDVGWWLLPVPAVSAATAALGLWLVRRATDVVGGATTTIRVLPAAVSLSGLAAWVLGEVHPLLGASVPLGGALVAAGATWPGGAPAVVGVASAGVMSALLLQATARDLDPEAPPADGRPLTALVTTALATSVWWLVVGGPVIWAAGGNPALLDDLPVARGVGAGALGLGLLVAVRAAAAARPDAALGLRAPAPAGIAAAVAAAGLLSALPVPSNRLPGFLDDATYRLYQGLTDVSDPLAAVAAIVAQELLLRGWLRGMAGDAVTIAAGAFILSPLDPLRGVALSLAATIAVRLGGGSVYPAIVMRLCLLGLLHGLG